MTRIYFAAGALLLGSSALAWAPDSVPVAHSAKILTAAVDPGAKAPATLLVAKTNALPKADGVAELGDASASWIADDQTLDETAPIAAAATATADYPPCSPGPGDDHCIQLYEPGVRAALASWNGPTGNIALAEAAPADSAAVDTETGMGGPYEPVDTVQMNGDGAVDTALGETAPDEGLASADASLMPAGSEYTGTGGPLEAVDYPPCHPGPGDDRCIQLYERGVTGR